jgi:hypothetical protein
MYVAVNIKPRGVDESLSFLGNRLECIYCGSKKATVPTHACTRVTDLITKEAAETEGRVGVSKRTLSNAEL